MTAAKQGFSLIQISMLIAVAGIILASVLPGGELGSDIEKERITREKMQKIEEATQEFMASNLRRPCPADGTLAIGNASFGIETGAFGFGCSGSNFFTQSTPFTKTGATTALNSSIATTLSNTTGLSIGMLVTGTNIANYTHIASIDSASQITLNKTALGASGTLTFTSVAAGVVPTRTLGLPDDFMFDGYGRRIGYMVDIRATDQTTCRKMQTTKTNGAIQIMDSTTAIFTTDNVMWSLISYGKNGHGAFPMQGSSIANRINSGATNDAERTNAFVATGSTSFATTFTQKLIEREPTSTAGSTYYDDIVWTQEASKNTCCTGKMCNIGARIVTATGSEWIGTNIAIGDINGDDISDMVIYRSGFSQIRVIFGSTTDWPMKGRTSYNTVDKNFTLGVNNNSRFITIANDSILPNFAGSVAVGDVNGDGFDDIAIGYGNAVNSFIRVFYGSSTPVDTNISAITNTITFPATSSIGAPKIVLGNFANTTRKDILALIRTASGTGNSTAYVIYGAGSYSRTAEAVTTVAATVGFKINTTSPGRLEQISETGDVNGDGFDDVIISNYTNNIMYVMFGRAPATWNTDKTTAATGSTPDIVNIDSQVTLGVTKAIKFTNGGTDIGLYTITVADMNNDTYKDIIFNNGNYFYVYYGKLAASWTSPDLSAVANYNGTNGFRFDVVTTKPSGVASPITDAIVEDINGDGKNDIVFNDSLASINGYSGNGVSFVALQPSVGWSSIWTSGTLTLFAQIFDATGTGLPLNNNVSRGYQIYGHASSIYSSVKRIVDINNDGKKDLIIGAPESFSDGNIYILFGRTIVPWDPSTNLNLLN